MSNADDRDPTSSKLLWVKDFGSRQGWPKIIKISNRSRAIHLSDENTQHFSRSSKGLILGCLDGPSTKMDTLVVT